MKTAYQILCEAQDLIRDPAKHTTETYARTADGSSVNPDNPRAVC